jgi:plasmid stability protein
MGTLLVRDVSDDLVRRLKERARANGRSAEAEHREILRRALSEDDGARFEELAAQQGRAEKRSVFRHRNHPPAGRRAKPRAAPPRRRA